jgi:hypothetical protein
VRGGPKTWIYLARQKTAGGNSHCRQNLKENAPKRAACAILARFPCEKSPQSPKTTHFRDEKRSITADSLTFLYMKSEKLEEPPTPLNETHQSINFRDLKLKPIAAPPRSDGNLSLRRHSHYSVEGATKSSVTNPLSSRRRSEKRVREMSFPSNLSHGRSIRRNFDGLPSTCGNFAPARSSNRSTTRNNRSRPPKISLLNTQ